MYTNKIMLISVTLCAVLTCTLAANSCSGGSVPEGSLVPHETNCGQYRRCWNGNFLTFNCTSNLQYFDACTKKCGSSQANCLTCNNSGTTPSSPTTTLPNDTTTTLPNDITTDINTEIPTFPTDSTVSEQTTTTTVGGNTTVANTTPAGTTTTSVPTAPIVVPTPPTNP